MKTPDGPVTNGFVREPGLRPLPWPPLSTRSSVGRTLVPLGAAWALSCVAAVVLGYLSVRYQWYNYPVGSVRLGFYPPWTIGVLWALWFGWGYGATVTFVSCLIIALIHSPGAANPITFPGALLLSSADAAGLYLFVRFLTGFPLDTRIRSLRDAGVFCLAVFLASVTGANGCFVVASEHGWIARGDFRATLIVWEGWWLGHFVECFLVIGPLATLLGPAVERWKTRHFECPPREATFRRQAVAATLAGLALIVFYSILLQAPGQRMLEVISKLDMNDSTREALIAAKHAADWQRGIVLATLLGLGATGIWIALALRRRYAMQLRQEFQRHGEDLRRGAAWNQAMTDLAEDGLQPLDTETRAKRLAESVLRVTGAREIRVLVREPGRADALRLAARAGSHANGAEARSLPLQGSLPGQAVLEGSPLYVERDPQNHPVGKAHLPYLEALHAHAYLCVPLMGPNGAAGALEILSDQAMPMNSEGLRRLRAIGRIGGAALARSSGGERQHLDQAETVRLSRLAQDLAEENDSHHLMQRIAGSAAQFLGAGGYAVLVAEEGSGGDTRLVVAATSGLGEGLPAPGMAFPLAEACLAAECAREGRSRSAGLEPSEPAETPLVPGWNARVALAVPFAPFGKPPLGALVAAFPPARKAGQEEEARAEELARLAGAGLRRLRLLEDTRRQAAEIALFEQIGRSFAEHLSVEDTLNNLVRNVSKIFPARWAAVFEYDPNLKALVSRATSIPHPDAASIRIPPGARSLVATTYREGKTAVSSDLVNDPRSSPELNAKYGSRSGVSVPLGPAGQILGVLFACDPAEMHYREDDVRRLEQIAALASVALERAYLHEEVRRRVEELAILHEVGSVLVETLRLDTSLNRIADIVRRHFRAAGAGFLLAEPGGQELTVRGASGSYSDRLLGARVKASEPGIILDAYRERKAMVVTDIGSDPRIGKILSAEMPTGKSGIVVPLNASHHPIGVLGIFYEDPRAFSENDIQRLDAVARLAASAVERERLGQALQASEARINEILNSTPAVVIGLDLKGAILTFNATAERVTGYRVEEAMGKDCLTLLYPDPIERVRVSKMLRDAFAADGRGKGEITAITRKDGKLRKIRWTGEALRDAKGELSGIVGMGLDVTEQLELEAQFLQAQKMESVGALAGGMAHDFNNLLGGILGQSALAHAQLRPGDPVHKILKKIESAAQRGADLTSKLLAFARRSVIQPMPVDIGLLLRETAELLAGSLPREITVISHVTPNMPPVEGDPTQLQQVILNLCVNARDAMPHGGTLNLRAAPGEAGWVRLEIADSGTGMTEDVKAHLFEPFFTTKEKGKGTGLGLAVVFGIVRSHRGRIEVDSTVGKGTCFLLHFPFMTAKPAPPPAAPAGLAEPDAITGTEELLLIDDEAIMRETTQKLLESLGYRVHVASGGEEGLNLIDVQGVQPRVIVLDVMMPGLAGVPLFHELRKRLPRVPVILISGFSREREVQNMLQAGAQELIQKPFRLEELATAIRRALQVAVR
ncbi:MAG: GAF domain-containing protein [Planctomycetota bacterium]|nr:GAF domain-containing protein [Planctomycetota bacterium]